MIVLTGENSVEYILHVKSDIMRHHETSLAIPWKLVTPCRKKHYPHSVFELTDEYSDSIKAKYEKQ